MIDWIKSVKCQTFIGFGNCQLPMYINYLKMGHYLRLLVYFYAKKLSTGSSELRRAR